MTNKPPVWHAVEVTCSWEAQEAIESALNELDALGTEINNLGKTATENIKVVGYFHERLDDDVVADQLAASLHIYELAVDRIQNVTWSIVEDKDWLAEWKKHWKPTKVGPFVIAPPWSEVESGGIVIRIEPNMAFGTGTHETTQLCLEAIGRTYTPEQSFLDIGTGTGILAIAVAKLGGSSITACDTDHDSVVIARENAAANGVANKISFFEGAIDDQTPSHDLVCANVTLDVIAPMLSLLISKARSMLLLSGILAEQEQAIRKELAAHSIESFDIDKAGEWISVSIPIIPPS